MSSWLARQSRFVLTASIVLAAAGTFALLHLPVGLFPAIDFPRLAVSLEAGDRPADQMVAQVTRPAEERLRTIPGVRNIRSQTSRGSAEISVMFNWGRDMTTATLQAESELARLSTTVPEASFEVRRMDPTIFPVLGYSLTSNNESLVSLRNFALYQLRPLLAAIDGVAEVTVLGGRDWEYQIVVDPVRLESLGLSIDDVESALAADNVVSAAGKIEDRSRLLLTLVEDRLKTVEDIGSIVVKSEDGNVVQLDDIAAVELGLAPDWTRVTADGTDAVLINIRQAPDANSLALTDAVKNILRRESAHFPPGIQMTPFYDQSDLVRSAAGSVRDAILIGTLLAGLVIFVFLRSVRFVLIVAILLPAALVSTALLLSVLGLTLNIMTLGGMAAAVGLIVDDVVVMLEHITRRLSGGTVGALEASGEMTRPLVGSSLATIIVFTPLAFLSGVTGGFFKALAVTMAASLFFSMIFGLTVVPLLARRFTDARDAERAETANAWLRAIGRGYDRMMRRVLHHSRPAAAALILVAVVGGGLAAKHVSSGFMPAMDEGGFVLDYVAPAGLSLTETDRLVRQIEQIIRSTPEVRSYSRRTGVQLGGGLTEANEGDMFVRLNPPPRRSIDDVMAEIRSRVSAEVPGIEIETIQLMADLIGDLTAVPQPIEVKLYGTDPAALEAGADEIKKTLEGIQGVVEVQKSDRVAGDAILISLDRPALAIEALDPGSVAAQLGRLVGGAVPNTIQAGERGIDVRVWADENLRNRVASIEHLTLSSPDGHLLPLGRVADVSLVSGQPQISRENLQGMTAVTGRLEGRDMGSAMRDVNRAMAGVRLPAGTRYEFGGLYAEQQKSFRDLTLVFGAAFTLSALLLLYLFRDFSRTVSILGVVVLSIGGVLFGLWVTRTELNIAAMMGLTMVIGIIAELGVFYFAELPDGETEHHHRISAGLARLRPITMSALIAILALLPIALKIGEGSALLAPMAVAIISGLLVGAPLVLVAGPVFHGALGPHRRGAGAIQ
ncbi:MAG: efflux RND transporter permease subunit [Candidatus Eisenbacteria bacterium]|uniref:Efflux RND transporter permease subunit n=1 Tax=Eiseniibacteriota bacterium TaxID=2212470 RepID=A0A956NKX7_UNCEI|nr:efflux RND transporter permease subunit [Candidatus Eisenbacteria bacterium]